MKQIYFLIIFTFSLTQCFAVENNVDAHYFQALKDIDKAHNLSQYIEDEHVKSSILYRLESLKKNFQEDFKTKDFTDMADRAACLYENLDEILADGDQDDLKMTISAFIEDIVEQFQE